MPSSAAACMLPLALFRPGESLGGPLGGSDPDLTRYLVFSGILVAAIVAVGWGFRGLIARGIRERAARRSLRVLDVLPLGGKRRLVVVRCYDRSFVLGLGEREISCIAELERDADSARPALPAADVPAGAEQSFAALLGRRMEPGAKSARPGAKPELERVSQEPGPRQESAYEIPFERGRGILG